MGLTVLVATGCGKTSTKVVVVAVPAPASIQVAPQPVYRVPSGSMEPTYGVGSHALIRPLVSTPTVGDIVVFHPPKDAEQQVCGPAPHMVVPGGAACAAPESEESIVKFIKRIVAGPGDVISIREGHVIRNGQRESDSYIRPCQGYSECNFPTPITIPAGHWFMLGDNRGASDDSRFWGPVPTGWIIGVAHPCSVVGLTCVPTK